MKVNPLLAHLEASGETAAAFAERLRISRSFLSRLMAGEREADATLLASIKDATRGEVTPDAWVAWWKALPEREREDA